MILISNADELWITIFSVPQEEINEFVGFGKGRVSPIKDYSCFCKTDFYFDDYATVIKEFSGFDSKD